MDTYRAAIKAAGNVDSRVYRKSCPYCNLETIVRRSQLRKVESGLHVICCQCQIDWCFMCEDTWHPDVACNENNYNFSLHDGIKEDPGNTILGDSIEIDEMRMIYKSLYYQDMNRISTDRSIESSTVISNKDFPSIGDATESDNCKRARNVYETFNYGPSNESIADILSQAIPSCSAEYINRFDDNDSIELNFEKTCDICLYNSTDDVRPCCRYPICYNCMRTYLTLKIDNAQVDITCPNHGCNKILSGADIERSVNGKTFLKYQQFVVNANKDPNRKTCPSCNYITAIRVLNRSKEGLRIRCPECSLSWCFNCQAPWHRDMTCSKFQSRHDRLFKKWASCYSSGQMNARKCPTCQVYIQRTGGCDHMKCTQCGTDFCYQCGVKGIHRHNETVNNINGGVNNLHHTDQPVSRLNRLKAWGWLALFLLITVIIMGSPFLAFLQSSGIHDMKSQNNSEIYPLNPHGSALNK